MKEVIVMTQVTKIAISLPKDLLKQVDEIAEELKKSRSAIVRDALVAKVNDYMDRETAEKARKIYAEISKEDIELSEKFISISSETIPPYEGGDPGDDERK
jgi:metal-responsive CopG/Arc/MetJ family transcriptional regulator